MVSDLFFWKSAGHTLVPLQYNSVLHFFSQSSKASFDKKEENTHIACKPKHYVVAHL